MAFKIKGKESKENVELWLEEDSDGVCLKGRDCDGDVDILMTFSRNMFRRNPSVNLEGVRTNNDGEMEEGGYNFK